MPLLAALYGLSNWRHVCATRITTRDVRLTGLFTHSRPGSERNISRSLPAMPRHAMPSMPSNRANAIHASRRSYIKAPMSYSSLFGMRKSESTMIYTHFRFHRTTTIISSRQSSIARTSLPFHIEPRPPLSPLPLPAHSFSKSFGLGSPIPSSLIANRQSLSGKHGLS
jgi:hypothetical protein